MSAGEELSQISRQVGPAYAEIAGMLTQKRISRSTCDWAADQLEQAAARLRMLAGVKTNDSTEQRGTQD